MVNLLCCGGHSSNITSIDAKTIYRRPYLLDVSQPYLQNHIRISPRDVLRTSVGHVLQNEILDLWGRPYKVCRRRLQDVGMGRPMALHIGQYRDVSRTLHQDVFMTSHFDNRRMFVEDVLTTSEGDIPWRYIQGHMGTFIGRLLGTSSGHLRDVILPGGKSVCNRLLGFLKDVIFFNKSDRLQKLQSSSKYSSDVSKVGLQNIGLCTNIATGYQFHFDVGFTTIRNMIGGRIPPPFMLWFIQNATFYKQKLSCT